MKKFLALFLCFVCLAALVITGCSHNRGSGVSDAPIKYTKTVEAGSDTTIEFDNFKLEIKDGTLAEGIEVTVTPITVTSSSADESLVGSARVYDIRAVKTEGGVVASEIAVQSVETPVTITIQNDITGADEYYIGTREKDGDPWKYSLLSSERIFLSSRLAVSNPSQFIIETCNVNQQFCLFAHMKDAKATEKAVVSYMDIAPEKDIKVVNKTSSIEYAEDLSFSVIIGSDKASSLSAADFAIELSYQNGDMLSDQIEVDGAASKPEYHNYGKGTGRGDKCLHTITFNPAATSFINNSDGITVNLLLKLNGLATSVFAESFNVKLSNAASDSKVLPFAYSAVCKLKATEIKTNYITAELTSATTDFPVDEKL